MATISVLDGSGNPQTLNVPNPNGQATMANSAPVAIASDNNIAKETGGNLASLVAKLPSQGQTTMSASQPVTLAVDQSLLPIITPGAVQAPSAQLATSAATVGPWVVKGGSIVALTLSCGPLDTAPWVGTVGFQWSPDNVNWYNLTAQPKSSLPGSGNVPVTSATAPGLWLAQLSSNALYVRYNVTAYTSGNIWCYCDEWGQANSRLIIPFSPQSATGTLVGPIESSGLAGFQIQLGGTYSATVTWQGTNDPTGTTWSNVSGQDCNVLTGTAGTSSTSVSNFKITSQTFKWFRAQVTAYTSGTVSCQGVSALLGAETFISNIGGSLAITGSNLSTSLSQLGGATVATAYANNAASARSQGAYLCGPFTNTDYNSQAWAATSGSGATVSDNTGAGAICAFDVNLSAWTAGSSTGLDIFLQWSPDGGTTWYDQWQCEALTAAGHVFIPPLPVYGKRRMRWVNRTGAATTATVTVTATNLSSPPPPQYQWFDRTAGLLSGTLNATSSSYMIGGCSVVNARVTIGAATTPGTYQIQVSSDGANWANVGTATAAVASSTVSLSVVGISARFARVICTSAATGQTGTVVAINATQ